LRGDAPALQLALPLGLLLGEVDPRLGLVDLGLDQVVLGARGRTASTWATPRSSAIRNDSGSIRNSMSPFLTSWFSTTWTLIT
jgi:hypothetical protein